MFVETHPLYEHVGWSAEFGSVCFSGASLRGSADWVMECRASEPVMKADVYPSNKTLHVQAFLSASCTLLSVRAPQMGCMHAHTFWGLMFAKQQPLLLFLFCLL